MKIKFNKILKSTVKLILPDDCPEELIDYHVDSLKNNIKISIIKIKSLFKNKIKNKTK